MTPNAGQQPSKPGKAVAEAAKRAATRARRYRHIAWSILLTIALEEDPHKMALTVARCESGHSMTPRAHNGQYLGMFQMGSYARSRYGHGDTPLEQARAAHAYWQDDGWSPWQCSPYGGLQW